MNIAISFHLRSLVEPRTESLQQKAQALYGNAVQILENAWGLIESDNSTEQELRDLHDLLVMISLNNRIVLRGNCGNADDSMQRLGSVLTQRSCSREYMDSSMFTAVSEWQQDILTNLIVLRMDKPMSAPTA
eukprot:Nitzschia sp. Nitz4//scaffold73_size107353//1457//1852//NITZ4_004304-RA/size107353-processed-gene-0.176-mRNA-1//-1//CDS//3329557428//1318//frame0